MANFEFVVAGMICDSINDLLAAAIDDPVTALARESVVAGLVWASLDEFTVDKRWCVW